MTEYKVSPVSWAGAGSQGLNEVLTKDQNCYIALETMAGKGSEIGRNFEELAAIFDRVILSDRLRVCMDTCHLHPLTRGCFPESGAGMRLLRLTR